MFLFVMNCSFLSVTIAIPLISQWQIRFLANGPPLLGFTENGQALTYKNNKFIIVHRIAVNLQYNG